MGGIALSKSVAGSVGSETLLQVNDQADLLLRRGMVANPSILIQRLEVVSYYRLRAYWHPFLQQNNASDPQRNRLFKPGTSFAEVWQRYVFDRHLRLMAIDAIERVEVALRSSLARTHGERYGELGYTRPSRSLPNMLPKYRRKFLKDIRREFQRSRNPYVQLAAKENVNPPVWMAVELMSLGTLLSFYKGLTTKMQRNVAKKFGIHHVVLESWLTSLLTVRNICAHHGRLWNSVMGTRPMIPKKAAEWHHPVETDTDRVFSILTILKYLMNRVAPQSHWPSRFSGLLAQYPSIPLASMGFPTDWERCPIWAYKQST